MQASKGKMCEYEQTTGRTKHTTKCQCNRYNSEALAVIGLSQISLVDTDDRKRQREWWGARHTLVIWGLLGVAVMSSMRVNLSVAIIAMVKSEPKNVTFTGDVSQICLPPDGYDLRKERLQRGEFDWDEAIQGQVLGVFYYGYLIGNPLGGIAAEHFGGKPIFGWGVVLTGIFTVVSPFCAKISTGLFIGIRILQGLSQGIMYPALNCLLAKWIPPLERTKFTSVVYAGAELGTVVAMPMSGWLCDTDFLGGWPSVFYVFGTLGIIWGIPWYFLVYSTPDLHARISVDEKAYISKSCSASSDKDIPIPWKAICTSTPFWAIVLAQTGYNWGFYTLLAMLPTYLHNIQHFDITSNGLLSALSYFLMWMFSMFYGTLMSHIQESGKLSTITIRRLAMAISMYGPMVALGIMCFVDCDQILAVFVICIAVMLCGAVNSGYMCSHQDLSPNLGGTLMGFTNGPATIPGILGPSVTGLILNGNQTLSAWRTIFLLTSMIYMTTGSFYVIFASAETQPWNFPQGKIINKTGENEKTRYNSSATIT